MIVDSSAIMAILLWEPEREAFSHALYSRGSGSISAGTWIELAAVLTRRSDDLTLPLEKLMKEFRIAIAPVSVEQGKIGHDAYGRYGRGTEHPAKLNLGDCFAYALAKETGEPLLFKGDDFNHTDITLAR